MKFEGTKIIEIDREAEEVSIPPIATRICEVACFFGSITSLGLENTNVIIIEKHAFANCYNLKEVRFSSCLEEICEGAFKQCQNLGHILFPSDSRLRKIGNNAFKDCAKLESFRFPRLLEFIGDYSFDGCWVIKSFDLRETKVRHVDRNSFNNSATIYFPSTVAPDDIISISNKSCICHIEVDKSHPVVRRDPCGYYFANGTIFQWNKEPRRVLIRRGVERIAGGCFYRSSLVSVTIPSSVTEISDSAFSWCERLKHIRFTKDSQLRFIGKAAFSYCTSIRKIYFPKSLKIIKDGAFNNCDSLERVVFPRDSQLERIEEAFELTAIKHLILPPSVKKIFDFNCAIWGLESIFVSNDYYQSNEEGSAIFSRDGSELVFVIKTLKHFEIPDSVRVIKRRAFSGSLISNLIIPTSVEIIEEEAFLGCLCLKAIELKEGSRLKSIAFDVFYLLEDLIINNENFFTMENGVVMSLNPRGIVFVPKHLTELEIPPGVEVIYSSAFKRSKIMRLKFPKSLKKICSWAFYYSSLKSVAFEEGTELDFIGTHAFNRSKFQTLKLPNIRGDIDEYSLEFDGVIEFPPNLWLRNKELKIMHAEKIVCPRSSLQAVAYFSFNDKHQKLAIIDK